MDMEAALRARLLAAGPVTALTGQRVDWVERPQGAALPAVTLQLIEDARAQHMEGFSGAQRAVVQVDAWATTYAQGKALKEAIIAALVPANESNGIRFERGFVTARDLSERAETQFIFRPSLDFTFHYAPAQ
jgi:hypothetical protein